MEQIQIPTRHIRPLPQIIKEVIGAVESARALGLPVNQRIKDYRWEFDQVSAKMNQAIFNDQTEQIHNTCLETVAVLIEMLARS